MKEKVALDTGVALADTGGLCAALLAQPSLLMLLSLEPPWRGCRVPRRKPSTSRAVDPH